MISKIPPFVKLLKSVQKHSDELNRLMVVSNEKPYIENSKTNIEQIIPDVQKFVEAHPYIDGFVLRNIKSNHHKYFSQIIPIGYEEDTHSITFALTRQNLFCIIVDFKNISNITSAHEMLKLIHVNSYHLNDDWKSPWIQYVLQENTVNFENINKKEDKLTLQTDFIL